MGVATLTSKGQLTLPKEVRERLALRPGDKLRVEVEGDDSASLRKLLSIEELFGRFPTNGVKATLEEMQEAAQEAVADHVVRSLKR